MVYELQTTSSGIWTLINESISYDYNRSICRCLPPDTTWHKVKSPKAD